MKLPRIVTRTISPGCVVEHCSGWLESEGFSTPYLRDLWRTTLHDLDSHARFVPQAKREISVPRLECLYGSEGTTYDYSGLTYHAKPLGISHARLMDRMRRRVYDGFNACFVNLYRTGADSISWHADDEATLGPVPGSSVTIASISLGETRRFKMKPREGVQVAPVDFDLEHGDLLIMRGACQRDWLHCLPKTKRKVRSRMAFTFRQLVEK